MAARRIRDIAKIDYDTAILSVHEMLIFIADRLADGHKVELRGFGTFYVVKKEGALARVKFRASKKLRDLVS